MFTWTEKDLNAEQAEAVRFPGSLLLVACPGSGKTRTLTYKLAHELSQLNTTREFVAAITYTHRAADEIRERIEDLGVDTAQLWIGTIHSFCLEWILKPYGIYEAELAHGFRVIDMHEREKLLERLCDQYRTPRVTFWDCDYYFTKDGYVLGCPDGRKHEAIQQILGAYFGELAANHQIDFELILWHAYQLVAKNPSISELLSKIFKVVLVDEYQDTKEIQYAIIASLLRAGRGGMRLFMVGDPNQAIYGSLGGYPIELEELRALSGLAIESGSLSRNYRSSARIVSYFGNFNVHHTAIEAVGPERNYPSLVSFNQTVNHEALADEIARLLRHNVVTLGISPHEICILAPQWVHLATMTRRLTVLMPEYEFDGPGMVPFARDIENFWYRLARLALTDPSPTM
jgi:superfamily I DNA/RNA helicase